MNNVATPKFERFEEEWTKLDMAPIVMRGRGRLVRSLTDFNEREAGVFSEWENTY